MKMDTTSQRRARTSFLIQLGGLLDKSGLLEEFGITRGADLQRDSNMQEPVATLMGALLELKDILQSQQLSLTLLREKGLKCLAEE